jgi:hypothetical protein
VDERQVRISPDFGSPAAERILRSELLPDQLIGLRWPLFRDAADMIAKVRGEPVHLLVAVTADGVLRM